MDLSLDTLKKTGEHQLRSQAQYLSNASEDCFGVCV
jgi:hypothetical protein